MMKILLTNDDGIDAEGLRVVADWAKNLGHVTVCAPKVQQSGKSHAINIYTPFEIKKVDYEGADEAYAVDSSPADCVRFAGENGIAVSGSISMPFLRKAMARTLRKSANSNAISTVRRKNYAEFSSTMY